MLKCRSATKCPHVIAVALIAIFPLEIPPAGACTLCEVVVGTLSEEIGESTFAVIAEFVPPSKIKAAASPKGMLLSKFRVTKVLHGEDVAKVLTAYTLPDEPPTAPVLLFAFGKGADLQWTAPLELSPIALRYLTGLEKARESADKSLAYFLPYLVASDRYVHDDAYNEFARASFKQITDLRENLDRQWVLKHLDQFISDPDIASYRIRLMWTLLSVCGQPEDADRFVQLADDPATDRIAAGFDAALACYMTLVGESALPYVSEKFLTSDDREDVLTALNAIRFHAVETSRFEKSKLAFALHVMLRDTELAGYAIPELARMEDWSVADRLVQIYSQDKAVNIRVPIVNYLRTCPLPNAKALVERCRKLDASPVRRSEIMFRP